MANKAGSEFPKFERGQTLRASDLNQITQAIIKNITGGRGIAVSTFRDTVIIENTAPSCGGRVPKALMPLEIGDTIIKWRNDGEVVVNGCRWLSLSRADEMENITSVGDTSSNATAWASASAFDIFTYLWGNFANAELPIQDSTGAPSTRGVSAAADFAAHKRMPLPDMRDRIMIGVGYTNSIIGLNDGLDFNNRAASSSHDHGASGLSTGNAGGHDHDIPEMDTGDSTGWSGSMSTNSVNLSVGFGPDGTVPGEGTDSLYISPDPHSHDVDPSSSHHYHTIPSETYTTGAVADHNHSVSGSVADRKTPHNTACWYILAETP